MKVLHIALYDRYGGACIAGYRQHQALLGAGVDSRMWVRFKLTDDPTVTAFQPSLKFRPRLFRLLRRYWYRHQWKRAGKTGEMFDARSEHGADMLKGMPEADVINIQFAWDFLDYPALFRSLPSHIPIVITMHSMETITGGCAYASECRRFQNQCGSCPKLKCQTRNDMTHKNWQLRKKSYGLRQGENIHFVANSNWLAKQAADSGLLKKYPVSVIHYGVNTEIFRPVDRIAVRSLLGIPADMPVVGFAAAAVSNPRKGMAVLTKAMEGLDRKPFLLSWGSSLPQLPPHLQGLHLGNLQEESLCALALNAADIFVLPSKEEAFGQTGLEAVACGTPVVAFATGGIPEIIRDGQNGILVQTGSRIGLTEGISKLLGDKGIRQKYSQVGRGIVQTEFSHPCNAKKYLNLYESMLALKQN